MWFSSWGDVGRVVSFTVLAYVAVLSLVRIAGKRAIGKRNASDFIITVAIGSAVASMILTKQVTLADGAACLAALVGLQFAAVTLSTRWSWARNLIEGTPKLLVYEGRLLADRLTHEHVNASEIYQAVRGNGIARLEDVLAVVLEIDGSLSVIPQGREPATTLDDVAGMPERAKAAS